MPQPGAWPVTATPVAAGRTDDGHVFAATQATAADFTLDDNAAGAVPITDAAHIRITVTYPQLSIASSASGIAVTVE